MGSPLPVVKAPQAIRGLSARSLISIGVFAAIYFVVLFGTGMIGCISPAAEFVGFLLGTVVNGTVVMLFMIKTPVPGAMTVLGTVVGPLVPIFFNSGAYFADIARAMAASASTLGPGSWRSPPELIVVRNELQEAR